jgi:glycosyltransferase involved in cell wall biosynthesis
MMHGRDVFVADGPNEFAAAAGYLMENQNLRSGLAEEGYRRVLEGYSWNVVVDRLQDCYSNVVEKCHNVERFSETERAQCG